MYFKFYTMIFSKALPLSITIAFEATFRTSSAAIVFICTSTAVLVVIIAVKVEPAEAFAVEPGGVVLAVVRQGSIGTRNLEVE